MSKKKDKDKSSVEEEINRLCDSVEDDPPGHDDTPGLQSIFSEFLQQQASQHQELMRSFTSLASSTQANVQAVATAVKDCIKSPVPPVVPPPVACAPAPAPAPVHPGLFTFEPEDEDGEFSSEEENDYDFIGWDVPPSGQMSNAGAATPSHCSTQAPSQVGSAETAAPVEGLFNEYELLPNWRGAPEIFAWLGSIANKEVPTASLKQINETFIPEPKYQPLFAAPVLPQAITDRLNAAPKGIARVPRIVNDALLRAVSSNFFVPFYVIIAFIIAFVMFFPMPLSNSSSPLLQQKELIVAYKPIVELLSFYLSSEFETLKAFVPDITYIFNQHKMLLSQSLALMVSASLKISKARKESIRPLFSVQGVLRQDPTASQVFGTEDLATLGERTAKEQATFRKIFRPVFSSRSRYKLGGNSRSYRGRMAKQ